jgi:hypothetical protein
MVVTATLVVLAALPGPDTSTRAAQATQAQRGIVEGLPTNTTDNPMLKPSPPEIDAKQKKMILDANLAKSRKDSEELALLAHELQQEMDKPGGDPLSPECALRLEKIAKLAKKIREELRGY